VRASAIQRSFGFVDARRRDRPEGIRPEAMRLDGNRHGQAVVRILAHAE
jgi:hypothetical protein